MASADDLKAAERTYSGFITMLKWAVPIVAATALLVIVLIAS